MGKDEASDRYDLFAKAGFRKRALRKPGAVTRFHCHSRAGGNPVLFHFIVAMFLRNCIMTRYHNSHGRLIDGSNTCSNGEFQKVNLGMAL